MKYGDRIQVTTSSTGSSTLTLSSALDSYFDLTTLQGGGLIPVTIIHSVAANNEAEVSLCSLSGSTLTRVKCVKSTNSNNFVNFSSGTKYVFIGLVAGINFPGLNQLKARCVVAELTTNKTLSDLVPSYVLNGVTLAAGDRVFLNAQSTASQNGVHVVQASGSPLRPLDFYTGDLAESLIPVGTALYVCTTPTAVIDTNSLTFSPVADLVGPTSSTDNAITRFDGTTGKLVQNSSVTIDDNGKVTGKASASTPYVTSGSGTINLDCALYNYFDITATGTVTLTISNVAHNQPIFVRLRQDGTGSRTINLFTGISWPDNAPPDLTLVASHWDNLIFICRSLTGPVFDGGWFGLDYGT